MGRRTNYRAADDSEINITPMLDIVFIMLIFFIVTTSFVREEAIDVARPTKSSSQETPKTSTVVQVRADGAFLVAGREVSFDHLRVALEPLYARNPDEPLAIIGESGSQVGNVVRALDVAKSIGFAQISVAAEAR